MKLSKRSCLLSFKSDNKSASNYIDPILITREPKISSRKKQYEAKGLIKRRSSNKGKTSEPIKRRKKIIRNLMKKMKSLRLNKEVLTEKVKFLINRNSDVI